MLNLIPLFKQVTVILLNRDKLLQLLYQHQKTTDKYYQWFLVSRNYLPLDLIIPYVLTIIVDKIKLLNSLYSPKKLLFFIPLKHSCKIFITYFGNS